MNTKFALYLLLLWPYTTLASWIDCCISCFGPQLYHIQRVRPSQRSYEVVGRPIAIEIGSLEYSNRCKLIIFNQDGQKITVLDSISVTAQPYQEQPVQPATPERQQDHAIPYFPTNFPNIH